MARRGKEACPDENLLAAFAERRLLDAERERVEEHLVRCETCLELVSEIARPDLDQEPVAAPTRSRLRPFLLVAAALLVVVGIGLVARKLWNSRVPAPPDPARLEAMLETTARDLARARPDRFSGFAPLTREERLRPQPAVARGDGVVLIRPVKNILETRPTFAWESPAGVAPVEIVLYRIEGASRIALEPLGASCRKSRVPYPSARPELEPGKYQWRIHLEGPFGRTTSSPRSFTIVPEAERKAYLAAAGDIEEKAAERIRFLLEAHLAIRRGLFEEAEKAVRRHLRTYPEDRLARETLYHVLATVGSVEAPTVLPARPGPDEE
jgi:hypothetical protein